MTSCFVHRCDDYLSRELAALVQSVEKELVDRHVGWIVDNGSDAMMDKSDVVCGGCTRCCEGWMGVWTS